MLECSEANCCQGRCNINIAFLTVVIVVQAIEVGGRRFGCLFSRFRDWFTVGSIQGPGSLDSKELKAPQKYFSTVKIASLQIQSAFTSLCFHYHNASNRFLFCSPRRVIYNWHLHVWPSILALLKQFRQSAIHHHAQENHN